MNETNNSFGSVWTGADGVWVSLPPPAPLEEVVEDAELVKQYRLKYGQDCKCQTRKRQGPQTFPSLWPLPFGLKVISI